MRMPGKLSLPPRFMGRFRGPALALILVIVMAGAALAEDWDFFVAGKYRQLRSVTLGAEGRAPAPANATLTERRALAVKAAKKNALRKAREALDREIRLKNPNIRYAFLGQPADSTPATFPEDSCLESVFILNWDDLPAVDKNHQGVSIWATVVYVIFLPQDEEDAASPPPLPTESAPGPTPPPLATEQATPSPTPLAATPEPSPTLTPAPSSSEHKKKPETPGEMVDEVEKSLQDLLDKTF